MMKNKIFQISLISALIAPNVLSADCDIGYHCRVAPNNDNCAGNNYPEPCCGGLDSCLTENEYAGCCVPNSSDK